MGAQRTRRAAGGCAPGSRVRTLARVSAGVSHRAHRPASSCWAAVPAATRRRSSRAQLGADVTVVDSDGLGGSAVLTDCVPSKTLIATAEVMTLSTSRPSSACASAPARGDPAPDATSASTSARSTRRVKALAQAQSEDIAHPAGGARGSGCCRGTGRLDGPGAVVVDDGRRARRGRGRRRAGRDRRAPAGAARRGARRRAHPHLDPAVRPRRAARAAGRRRLRRHRRRVRQSPTTRSAREVVLVSSRDRVLPGEDADAAAGARGRLPPPRHDRAEPLAGGVGAPRGRRRRGDPRRRPHGRGQRTA